MLLYFYEITLDFFNLRENENAKFASQAKSRKARKAEKFSFSFTFISVKFQAQLLKCRVKDQSP